MRADYGVASKPKPALRFNRAVHELDAARVSADADEHRLVRWL